MKKLILALVALIITTTAVFAGEEEKRAEIEEIRAYQVKIERELEECKDPFDKLTLRQYKTAITKYQIAKENINSTFDHIENSELRKINERAREADIMLLPGYISDIKWICNRLDRMEVEHTHWEEIVDEQ